MNRNADEAQKFVAVAHFPGERDREGVSEGVTLKTVSLSPESTIAELMIAFWPEYGQDPWKNRHLSKACFTPPFRIEILPDEKSVTPYKLELELS